jgi:hypothetical protein
MSREPTSEPQSPEKLQTIKASQYGELILYAALFLLLVSSVFVLNFVLAKRSEAEAKQIGLATQSARAWQTAEKNLRDTHIKIFTLNAFDSSFKEFASAIKEFDQIQTALKNGGTAKLLGKILQSSP